jgi:hypothetical protein
MKKNSCAKISMYRERERERPILTLMMAGLSLLASSLTLKSAQSISPEIRVPTFTHSILYIRAALKTE